MRKRSDSRSKRRKIDHTDLAQFISPFPIHWKIQSVEEEDGSSENHNHGQRGRFRIKLKIQKHPIKDALLEVGARNFTVDEMLKMIMKADEDRIEHNKLALLRLKE